MKQHDLSRSKRTQPSLRNHIHPNFRPPRIPDIRYTSTTYSTCEYSSHTHLQCQPTLIQEFSLQHDMVSPSQVAEPCIRELIFPGKDLVRVCRVVREGDQHHVAEYTVQGRQLHTHRLGAYLYPPVMLEGDIAESYTKADNSLVVATDTSTSIAVGHILIFAQ